MPRRDHFLARRLRELGFKVVVRNQTEAKATDLQGASLVVISDSTWSRFIDPQFRNVAIPLLTWEAGLYDDFNMTGLTTADYGVTVNQTQLTIATPGHPLAAGLSGLVTTNNRGTAFFWGVPSANATIIATATRSNRAAIFTYEEGATMVGLKAPARRIGFSNGIGERFTQEGWKLFLSAIGWGAGCTPASGGQLADIDSDNDGIPDTLEDAMAINGDTDNDGAPDKLDLDSDNDGLWDLEESGVALSVVATLDEDGNGRIDAKHAVGANGLANGLETALDSGQINYTIANADSDLIPDFQAYIAHYAGPVQMSTSDVVEGATTPRVNLYYARQPEGTEIIYLGAALTERRDSQPPLTWLTLDEVRSMNLTFEEGQIRIEDTL